MSEIGIWDRRPQLELECDRNLKYPVEWLHGWAHVLAQWPGSSRVKVSVDVHGDPAGRHGYHDGSANRIVIFPDSDRVNALTTLLHECAHAWCEPVHVGKTHCQRWRATYLDLFSFLTGVRLDVRRVEAMVRELGWRHGTGCRGDRFLANALDHAVDAQLRELDGSWLLWIRQDKPDDPRIQATAGGVSHVVLDIDSEMTHP